jgi:hypothetical protein
VTYYEIRDEPDGLPFWPAYDFAKAAIAAACRKANRLGRPLLVYEVSPSGERFLGET